MQFNRQMTLADLEQETGREVRQITYSEAKPFLLNIHYARRMPCVQYAFGLFEDGVLCGVVTYGTPASHHLCIGLAGEKNAQNVLELNRLVILPEYSGDNRASFLISHSLKLLPRRTFVVSYADTAWTHVGYVYQATNWLYTGMTAERTDIYHPDGKHPRHSQDYNKSYNIRQTRSAKHRYVYLVGNKKDKRDMRKEILWKVYDSYPKGDEIRYDPSNPQIVVPMKVIEKG